MKIKSEIIESYNNLETTFLNKCTYHQQMIFKPYQFINQGDPIRVENISQLSNFLDTQHTLDRSLEYLGMISKFDFDNEFEKLIDISIATLDLSKNFNESFIPVNALFAQYYQYKFIQSYIKNYKTILEIGPGSGYLSAMLAKEGYALLSTDVTQALYIYQSLIFDKLEILNETIYESENYNDDNAEIFFAEKCYPVHGKVTHLPWWLFKDLYLASNINIDLVIMNHTVLEVHPKCLEYIIALAKKLKVKRFLMESAGSPNSMQNFHNVINLFEKNSYYYSEVGYEQYCFDYSLEKPKKLKKYLSTPSYLLNKYKWKRDRFKKENYIEGLNMFESFIKRFKEGYNKDFKFVSKNQKFLNFINNQH
tara:strand:+ start:199 stop:1293 length:1095 start_codon:yes stop_codon:yes gene_type:complete